MFSTLSPTLIILPILWLDISGKNLMSHGMSTFWTERRCTRGVIMTFIRAVTRLLDPALGYCGQLRGTIAECSTPIVFCAGVDRSCRR